MATKFQFAGRTIRLPGIYSRIVSGRNNPPLDLDYGRLLIIAQPEQIRGGSGINGENASGKDSIYEIRDLNEMREFVGQGVWFKAAEALFQPNRFDPGVSRVFIVKASQTTQSTLTLGLEDGTNGGTLTLKTLDEGILANGVIEEIDSVDYLKAGYAFTVEPGVRDSSKWVIKFWLSTYTGEASDGHAFDENSVKSARPRLLAQSIEFNNMADLIDWADSNKDLAKFFIISSTNVKGSGEVNPLEIGALDGFVLSSGATETSADADFDAVLSAIRDLDYNLVMYKSGEDLESDPNSIKLISHLELEAKHDKFLIAGGSDDDLSETISTSRAINSDKVILSHGAVKKVSKVSASGFRVWNSLVHASYIAGRLAGLPPQVPITFKAIQIDGLVDNLTQIEREDALDAGVLVTNYDGDRGLFVVDQGINTLQDNDFTLNPNSTSHVIQIKRIAAQLNKELIVNGKRDLLSNPSGVNRNTLSERDIIDWTKGYLLRKIATDDVDNLILSFQNVTVTRQEDAYFVTYEFDPNSEIRIVFFTGFML